MEHISFYIGFLVVFVLILYIVGKCLFRAYFREKERHLSRLVGKFKTEGEERNGK